MNGAFFSVVCPRQGFGVSPSGGSGSPRQGFGGLPDLIFRYIIMGKFRIKKTRRNNRKRGGSETPEHRLPAPLADTDEVAQALMAVNQNGLNLYNASDKIKDDAEVVKAAVKENVHAFEYASARLKDHRNFVLELVNTPGNYDDSLAIALYYASDKIKDDAEVVKAAVKENVHAFEYASARLKDDKTFVLELMNQNVEAFDYASDNLKNDPELSNMVDRTSAGGGAKRTRRRRKTKRRGRKKRKSRVKRRRRTRR